MTMRYVALCASAVLAAVALQGTSAHALTMAECSAKYKAAKADNSLNGMKWNDFRKAQCGSNSTAAPTTASAPAAAPTPAPKPSPAPKTASAPAPAPARPAPVATGNAVFPSAVNPKYSTMSAGKQRMDTCLDQYRANKATNGNGGLKWIQKGGGYYPECNKHLKGA